MLYKIIPGAYVKTPSIIFQCDDYFPFRQNLSEGFYGTDSSATTRVNQSYNNVHLFINMTVGGIIYPTKHTKSINHNYFLFCSRKISLSGLFMNNYPPLAIMELLINSGN